MELSKGKQSIYGSLGSKKMRARHSLFMVEGEKSVADTLNHYDLEAMAVREGYVPEMIDISSIPAERVYEVRDNVMQRLSSLSTSPSVIAVYHLPQPLSINDLPPLKEADNELYLMLDGIQDPGNLGTIVRTAHWFGIRRIYASRDTADIYNPKTIQSTMGSLPHVEIVYCDLEEVADSRRDLPVYGLLLDGESIYDAGLGGNGFIVMGNEGKGISEGMRRKVTHRLLIPPYDSADHSESLNVAIATGITLSAFRRR